MTRRRVGWDDTAVHEHQRGSLVGDSPRMTKWRKRQTNRRERREGRTEVRKAIIGTAVYAGLIALANIMISTLPLVTAFGLSAPAGTLAAGLVFVARDSVHRYGGLPWALVAVVAGACASVWMASPQLALASGAAFIVAELADTAVYSRLSDHGRATISAVAVSGVVGSIIDTAMFLPLAGFTVTAGLIAGQLIIKCGLSGLAGGALWVVQRRFSYA